MINNKLKNNNLVSDEPTDNDLIGLTPYVFTLTYFLENYIKSGSNKNNSSFVISLIGPWGSGKSSVMKQVKNVLKSRKESFDIISINPWGHKKEEFIDIFFSEFGEYISEKLKNTSNYSLDSIDGNYYKVPYFIFTYLINLIFDIVKRIFVIIFEILNRFFKLIINFAQGYPIKKDNFISFIKLFSGKYFNNESASILYEIYNKDDHWANYKKNNHIRDIISGGIKKILDKNPNKKIVVFIDDIDRCTKEQIVNIFETIKLFLDIKDFVFILGYDEKNVFENLKSYFKDNNLEINPYEYIEKIIQLPIHIPKFTEKDTLFLSNSSGIGGKYIFENMYSNALHYINHSFTKEYNSNKYFDLIKKSFYTTPRSFKLGVNLSKFYTTYYKFLTYFGLPFNFNNLNSNIAVIGFKIYFPDLINPLLDSNIGRQVYQILWLLVYNKKRLKEINYLFNEGSIGEEEYIKELDMLKDLTSDFDTFVNKLVSYDIQKQREVYMHIPNNVIDWYEDFGTEIKKYEINDIVSFYKNYIEPLKSRKIHLFKLLEILVENNIGYTEFRNYYNGIKDENFNLSLNILTAYGLIFSEESTKEDAIKCLEILIGNYKLMTIKQKEKSLNHLLKCVVENYIFSNKLSINIGTKFEEKLEIIISVLINNYDNNNDPVEYEIIKGILNSIKPGISIYKNREQNYENEFLSKETISEYFKLCVRYDSFNNINDLCRSLGKINNSKNLFKIFWETGIESEYFQYKINKYCK